IFVENLGFGFGFVGLILYMMQVVSPGRYQTAHYAFGTGFMALGLVIFRSISGDIQVAIGYRNFFFFVLLCAIPVLLLSLRTVTLVDDPQQPGNRLLRLVARTDGTPQGTAHAQLCQARKFFEGTYAARVRFNDTPAVGPDGDVVVQTFYAVSPLRFDFDPEYS